MRIFITHVPQKDNVVNAGISIAATNFTFNLISNGAFDKVYSILPPFVNDKTINSSKDNIEIIYCSRLRNTPLAKLAPLLEQIKVFNRIQKSSCVWLYNITPLNGFLVKLLRIFKPSVKIYTIVLDFTPGDPAAERWLSTINSCDGRITLSMSDQFNKDNTICLPGVTPYETENWPKITTPTKEFIISGQLSDNISLLSKLLPVFAAHSDWMLNITGNAPELAKDYSKKYPNIICHGKCSYSEFLRILHKSPFLLSTRDPRMPENQCNFPSKIIEGLLHNRIIISTIDYPQLSPIKYLKVDAENLEEGLKHIVSMTNDTLLGYANQAELTDNMFNAKRWKAVMKEIEKNS